LRQGLANGDLLFDHHRLGRHRLLLDVGNDRRRRWGNRCAGNRADDTTNSGTDWTADNCTGYSAAGSTGYSAFLGENGRRDRTNHQSSKSENLRLHGFILSV
jgi:hypothetical protein